MFSLPASTQRRLKKIPQSSSVWEGDRRPMEGVDPDLAGSQEDGQCIIWLDGSEGVVRAMDMVSSQLGPEAIVRTLLRAIENPHSPAQPSRPQKIVVKDRETQFFLRGALQNLEINIDYAPSLPLIDELFRSLENSYRQKPPQVPGKYEKLLEKTALELWELSPWDSLGDHNILEIKLDHGDSPPLYVCVLGMLGQEYGIILYRSLESLKRFRQTVVMEKEMEKLENAFLSQDCWFVNFEPKEFDPEYEDEDFDLAFLDTEEIEPIFGSLHPLEGMRPFLDDEEALTLYLSLQGLKSFFEDNLEQLEEDDEQNISSVYQISLPNSKKKGDRISLTVSNLPEIAAEFLSMMENEDDDDGNQIYGDLIPDNSFLKFQALPWDMLLYLKGRTARFYGEMDQMVQKGKELPGLLVQTSRPKAEELIAKLREEGGVQKFCFNLGENPFTGTEYDLGIIQTGDGDFYVISEFERGEFDIDKWLKICKKNDNYFAFMVAMGITGVSRGNPKIEHYLAFFTVQLVTPEEMGLGPLRLMPQFDFPLDFDEEDED